MCIRDSSEGAVREMVGVGDQGKVGGLSRIQSIRQQVVEEIVPGCVCESCSVPVFGLDICGRHFLARESGGFKLA